MCSLELKNLCTIHLVPFLSASVTQSAPFRPIILGLGVRIMWIKGLSYPRRISSLSEEDLVDHLRLWFQAAEVWGMFVTTT